MVTNRCVRVEIHDFWVPTIGTYLLEILLENVGFVYLQLHSSCSCLMVVDCCLVLDLRQLLGDPSTSVGAAGVTVVSLGSFSCFTGLMG